MLDLKDFRTHRFDQLDLEHVIRLIRDYQAVDKTIIDSASTTCARVVLDQGVIASLREPTIPVSQLRKMGISHVSLESGRARSFYKNDSWSGLFVTAICRPNIEDVMWFSDRNIFAVITDLVEETLDELETRNYVTSIDNDEVRMANQ